MNAVANEPKKEVRPTVAYNEAARNYVTPGVSLGTAEIALRRYDPIFATQVKTFVKQQLGL